MSVAPDTSETNFSLLTPPGRGAVAVIAIAGPKAEPVIEKMFRPASGKRFVETGQQAIVYGMWLSTGEDLVIYRRGEQQFEIHCHGGNTASTAIIHDLASSGLAKILPTEFAQTQFQRFTVGVQLALTRATTVRCAKILLGQLESLPKTIEEILSSIEKEPLDQAITQIKTMLQWSEFGKHLTHPRSVVLCGQPNVGKSSLINAITGFQRVIVHDIPGTTRDVVTQSIAIDGWPIEVSDTAGIRHATNSIEAIGIEKAQAHIRSADLVVAVLDLSQPWTSDSQNLIQSSNPDLIVLNKADLGPIESPSRPGGIRTSTKTGLGIEDLINEIAAKLVPQLPPPGQAFPVSPGQTNVLKTTLENLDNNNPAVALKKLLQFDAV